jgi:hypothetical protein
MSEPASLPERCCCADWIARLASDALDVVQDAFRTLLDRPDITALRARAVDAATNRTRPACSPASLVGTVSITGTAGTTAR